MGAVAFKITTSVEESGKRKPEYRIDTDLGGELTLKQVVQWHKNLLLQVALDTLKEEQDMGFTKTPITVVDGRQNKNVTEVNPFGKIEFFSKVSGTKVLSDTYKKILTLSKVVTGQYKSSNEVRYNKNIVATTEQDFDKWLSTVEIQEGDEIVFINRAPYARRLETLGVTANRQQSRRVNPKKKYQQETTGKIKAPNGVYYLTYRSVSRRFKNHALISFTFVSGSNYGIGGVFKGQGKGAKSRGRSYLYPAIRIKFINPGALE